MTKPNERLTYGLELHKVGRIGEAIKVYESVLLNDSMNPLLWFLLGTAYYQKGRLHDGLRFLEGSIVLNPLMVEVYSNRGNLLKDLRHWDESLASYAMALKLRGDFAEARYNLGMVQKELGRQDRSILAYRGALVINPGFGEAFSNLGAELKVLGDLEGALCCYNRAIKIHPRYFEAYYNRANLFIALNRLDEALESIEVALNINPGSDQAYDIRGDVFRAQQNFFIALISYEIALTLKPALVDVHNKRGMVLQQLKHLKCASISFDRALAISPSDVMAGWNKSLLLLLLGQYELGWELYEMRWLRRAVKDKKSHTKGALPFSLACSHDAAIFIYAEQGLGDTIQFCRYVRMLSLVGYTVVFEVQPELRLLMDSLGPGIKLISAGEQVPRSDFQSPLLSLPRVFGTRVDTIPSDPAYLSASEKTSARWGERLGSWIKPRIGLVWSGSPRNSNDQNRSIPLKEILPALVSSYEWHSLQKEYREDDLDVLVRHPIILQHQEDLNDFTDTAALIEHMDLVVSVDTSVAHLAGALGKSVWILLPYSPDFRWLLDRNDSPWYPTASLYRQDAAREWGSVLSRVQEDLRQEFF